MPPPTSESVPTGPPWSTASARQVLRADRRRRLRASLPSALASLGLHAFALAALALWIEPPGAPPAERSPVISVTLQTQFERPLQTEPADAKVELETESESKFEPELEPAIGPERASSPAEAPASRTEIADPPSPPSPRVDPTDRETTIGLTIGLTTLRRQISALALPDDEDASGTTPGFDAAPDGDLPWTRSGAPIRGLPLGGGWLNPWVGPVESRSETWGSVVGEQRGVHVLANGQVICTRVDAPSNDELMNPWMSMRVTYVRLCGKERGTAPPSDDLRYAPPPPMLRRGD